MKSTGFAEARLRQVSYSRAPLSCRALLLGSLTAFCLGPDPRTIARRCGAACKRHDRGQTYHLP